MGTCFSFKVKCDCEGKLLECRVRAKAKGTQQKLGSYGKTFAPTSKFSVIRTICTIAAQENLTLYQFDVKGEFLLAPCKEPVYMNLPGRYKLQPHLNRDSFRDSFKGLVALEISIDLPLGFFPKNNIISLTTRKSSQM